VEKADDKDAAEEEDDKEVGHNFFASLLSFINNKL